MTLNQQVKFTESSKFTSDEQQKVGKVEIIGTVQKIQAGFVFIKIKTINYFNSKQVKILTEGQIIRRRIPT